MTVGPLGFGKRRMVLTEWGQRPRRQQTFWWNPFTNRVVMIADRPGYVADVSADPGRRVPPRPLPRRLLAVGVVRCTFRSCERVSKLYRTGGRDPWTAMPVWTFADESLMDR
jgi:hypothetical protein